MKNKHNLEFKIYKTAPIFLAALFFILGVGVAEKLYRFPGENIFFGPLVPTYAIAVILFTLVVSVIVLYGFNKKAVIAAFVLITMLGFFAAQIKIEGGYEKEGLIKHESITGRVAQIKENGANSISLLLDDVSLIGGKEQQGIAGRVSLILYGQSASFLESEFFLIGSIIEAKTLSLYPSEAAGYGFMSERQRLLAQNVFYKAICHYSALEVIEKNNIPATYSFFYSIRKNLFGSLERYVGGDESAFLQALTTGSKGALSSDIKSDFSMLGVSHLLATSGLHIGILLLAFGYFFKKMRTPIVLRAVISLTVILLFLCFAGFRVSMVRAAIMWSVIMASKLSGERISPLNSLGTAMLVMIIINPLCIFDISFVLSCVSVAAIALFSGKWNRIKKMKKGGKVLDMVLITVAVVTFTWPIIAFYFNSVPLLSPLYNIIFVPLSGVALFLGLLFGVFSQIGFMAAMLGTAAKALSFVMIKGADFLADFSPALSLVSPPFLAIVLWMFGVAQLMGMVVSLKSKSRRISSAIALTLALLIVVFSQTQALNRREITAYADGSVAFLYLEAQGENALLLNDDSYIAYTVLKKDVEKDLDMLIYSGNSWETLGKILSDLASFDIGAIYAAQDIALAYNAQYEAHVQTITTLEFLEHKIEFIEFKAKSKTAKVHYAAHIYNDAQSIIYLDPISLREGVFADLTFTDVISSRWTKSRAQNIEHMDFECLYYCASAISLQESALHLEQKGAKTYNITQAIKIFYPKGDR